MPDEMHALINSVQTYVRFGKVNFLETVRRDDDENSFLIRRFIVVHRGISPDEAFKINFAKRKEFQGSFPENINQDIMEGHGRWVLTHIYGRLHSG